MIEKDLATLKSILESNSLTIFLLITIPIINYIPDEWGLSSKDLKCLLSSIALLLAIVFLFLNYHYSKVFEYYKTKGIYNDLFEAYLKHIYIEKEILDIKLEFDKTDVESYTTVAIIERTFIINNLSNNIIDHFHVPWHYSLYEVSNSQEKHDTFKKCCVNSVSIKFCNGNGEIREIERSDADSDNCSLNPYMDQTTTMILNDTDYSEERGNDQNKRELFIYGWIKVPIYLNPNCKSTVKISYKQNHIFDKLFTETGEKAGTIISAPTKSLTIIVHPPDNYEIIPINANIEESMIISNKSLNLKIFSEICRFKPPIFNMTIAHWSIEKPKIGYSYLLGFRIIPIHNGMGSRLNNKKGQEN